MDANDATRLIGEAMQTAEQVKPHKTSNGRVIGVPVTKSRVTKRMKTFASLVAEGKSSRDAYREAYEVGDRQEHLVIAGAGRLMRDERIQRLTADVWEHVTTNVVDDAIAARRYVMARLKFHADESKTDGMKLKALELMGRAIGMFTDKVETKVEEVSTEKLKEELEYSLRLLDNVVPILKEVS